MDCLIAAIGGALIAGGIVALIASKMVSNARNDYDELEKKVLTICRAASAAHAAQRNLHVGKMTRNSLFNHLWALLGLDEIGGPR